MSTLTLDARTKFRIVLLTGLAGFYIASYMGVIPPILLLSRNEYNTTIDRKGTHREQNQSETPLREFLTTAKESISGIFDDINNSTPDVVAYTSTEGSTVKRQRNDLSVTLKQLKEQLKALSKTIEKLQKQLP